MPDGPDPSIFEPWLTIKSRNSKRKVETTDKEEMESKE
jgi:hypothetical protein